ncbi:MAG: ankyrin repeat domain-containing protein [Caldilinea sp. CFX5]|nr:ankyrin repeat domain-containing protein [Caldilinea sp. CFX5]
MQNFLFVRGLLLSCVVALLTAACIVTPIQTIEPAPSPTATAATGSNNAITEVDMRLIDAASQGDLAAVQQWLAQGANIHAADGAGVTALIAAAYANHLAVAEFLIEAGADVNVQDNTQQSAYLIATSEGYVDLLRLTLQAGADVQRTDSYNGTGLIRAADRGHVEIIQVLLETPIKLDHINRLGWTALLEAIILGDGGARHTEVVRLLVEAGADVNLADGNGVSPLAHAQQRGHTAIAEILRKAGAHE